MKLKLAIISLFLFAGSAKADLIGGTQLFSNAPLVGSSNTWTGTNVFTTSVTITDAKFGLNVLSSSTISGTTIWISTSNSPFTRFLNAVSTSAVETNSVDIYNAANQTLCPFDVFTATGTIMVQVRNTGLMTHYGYGPAKADDLEEWTDNNGVMDGKIDQNGTLTWSGIAAFPTAGNFYNGSVSANQFYRAKSDGSGNLVSYDLFGSSQIWTGGNTFASTTTLSRVVEVDATTTDSYVIRLGTTSSAGNYEVAITTSGHYVTNGSSPTISSCGTGTPAAQGDDNQGTITTGGGSPVACTLTFSKTWGTTPTCTIDDNVAGTSIISSISPTAFTANISVTATKIYYRCGCSGISCL